MINIIKKNSIKEQNLAKSSYLEITKLPEDKSEEVTIQLPQGGKTIVIPKKAFAMLTTILSNMAEGKSMTLLSLETEISTQQAADILQVSRPHLVKLLDQGQIPFKKAGSHRRILLKDVVAYEEQSKKEQADDLAFLTEQAQNLSLGY